MTAKEAKRLEIKESLRNAEKKLKEYKARFDAAPNLHEKEAAYVMGNAMRNRVRELTERLEYFVG